MEVYTIPVCTNIGMNKRTVHIHTIKTDMKNIFYQKDIKLRNYHQIINIAKLSKSAPAVQKCNNVRNLTSSETTVINKRCKDFCAFKDL